MLRNPVQRLIEWHRFANSEALYMVAAQLSEQSMLPDCLNPFCKSFQSKPLCHRKNRSDHALLIWIAIRFHHERPVDFDARYAEPPERGY